MPQLKNKSGNWIRPSLASTSAAANVPVPADVTKMGLTDTDGANGYSISSFTWILVYKEQNYDNRPKDKVEAMMKMIWWMIADGQQYAEPLAYAKLPRAVVAQGGSHPEVGHLQRRAGSEVGPGDARAGRRNEERADIGFGLPDRARSRGDRGERPAHRDLSSLSSCPPAPPSLPTASGSSRAPSGTRSRTPSSPCPSSSGTLLTSLIALVIATILSLALAILMGEYFRSGPFAAHHADRGRAAGGHPLRRLRVHRAVLFRARRPRAPDRAWACRPSASASSPPRCCWPS